MWLYDECERKFRRSYPVWWTTRVTHIHPLFRRWGLVVFGKKRFTDFSPQASARFAAIGQRRPQRRLRGEGSRSSASAPVPCLSEKLHAVNSKFSIKKIVSTNDYCDWRAQMPQRLIIFFVSKIFLELWLSAPSPQPSLWNHPSVSLTTGAQFGSKETAGFKS